MKRASNLLIFLVFALSGSFLVNAEDAVSFDQTAFSNDAPDASTIIWPMLPGESVIDLARLFYPNNQAMRRQFVSQTLRLNAQVDLQAATRFDTPTLLTIPTLKSLSKTAVKVSNKSSDQSLKMSYGLKQVEIIPQKLLQEYEELVNRNALLKQQLAKLNEKLVLLQSKLDALKLIFDKTLTLPNADLPIQEQPAAKQGNTSAVISDPVANLPTSKSAPKSAMNQPPVKKVFKNLNKQTEQTAESFFFDRLNMGLVKISLVTITLLLLGALIFTFILKKYRERILKHSDTAIKVQPTMDISNGHLHEKNTAKKVDSQAVTQQKAATDGDTALNTTLEEAKLLISVNRATDAIAHLKATIASQPKVSISHWLYLLDVFRKFNMKNDFEQYADRLHQTFNVMTPIWYEKSAEIYVPLSLEEFPHIMEQLYGIWPGELASVYLRDIVADNRGGDRIGFDEEVLDEILLLIAVLDMHKELPN